ncbi:MAG: hypothetical protein EA397_07895 [Deltaproteobacteria bacterium]|nr:MAG: hypothetical protein EA397_07895 [Deltaproteobacteria bacterium]
MDDEVRRMILVGVAGLGVLALVGGIGGVKLLWTAQERAGVEALAEHLGWAHVRDEDGTSWRMRGQVQGREVIVDTSRPQKGSANKYRRRHHTRLHTAIRSDSALWVGPKTPQGIGAQAFELGMVELVGEDAAEALHRGDLVSFDGPFGERFEVRVLGDPSISHLLTDKVQTALVAEADRHLEGVAVTVHEGQVQLWLGTDLRQRGEAEAFIQTGLTLIEGVVASGF